MTYRLDSDLVRPYGWFSPLQIPDDYDSNEMNPPIQELSWLTPTAPSPQLQMALKRLKKPKLVAWIASNCDTHSDREDYVQQLKKHIEVVFVTFSCFILASRWILLGSVEREIVGQQMVELAIWSAMP